MYIEKEQLIFDQSSPVDRKVIESIDEGVEILKATAPSSGLTGLGVKIYDFYIGNEGMPGKTSFDKAEASIMVDSLRALMENPYGFSVRRWQPENHVGALNDLPEIADFAQETTS